MGVATNHTFKDKEGNKQESVEFHDVIVFGKQADTCNQYLVKGQTVNVTGRIQTRSWDKEDGTKAFRTEIIANNVEFGAKPKGNDNGTAPSSFL